MKGWIFSIVVSIFLGAFIIGYDLGRKNTRAEAVQGGVGQWVITDDYGRKEFQWGAVDE